MGQGEVLSGCAVRAAIQQEQAMDEPTEQEKAAVLMIKGAISDMPKEDVQKVYAAADKIIAIIEENGEHGGIALALVGARYASGELKVKS